MQAETTRCWRCDKPAFTCRTCHFYRASVAADLGYCADDSLRTPLRADETRSCWEAAVLPGVGVSAGSGVAAGTGLFAEAEIAPPPPVLPRPPRPSVRTAPDRERRRARPPLEPPGRAAWVQSEADALVEAPDVEPGKRLTTEVQRRRRRWFR